MIVISCLSSKLYGIFYYYTDRYSLLYSLYYFSIRITIRITIRASIISKYYSSNIRSRLTPVLLNGVTIVVSAITKSLLQRALRKWQVFVDITKVATSVRWHHKRNIKLNWNSNNNFSILLLMEQIWCMFQNNIFISPSVTSTFILSKWFSF